MIASLGSARKKRPAQSVSVISGIIITASTSAARARIGEGWFDILHATIVGMKPLLKPLFCAWLSGAAAFSQTLPNPTLPLPKLLPGTTALVELSATSGSGSQAITAKPVKLDSTVQTTAAPDGTILISAVPGSGTINPPTPLFVSKVLWTPTTPAVSPPPGVQMFCLVPPMTPNWTPVAVVEERVSTLSGAPINYQLFYLVSFPSQAQGAATPEGLTWTRTSSLCAGNGAITYTPVSLPTTDTRVHVYVMVTGQ